MHGENVTVKGCLGGMVFGCSALMKPKPQYERGTVTEHKQDHYMQASEGTAVGSRRVQTWLWWAMIMRCGWVVTAPRPATDRAHLLTQDIHFYRVASLVTILSPQHPLGREKG